MHAAVTFLQAPWSPSIFYKPLTNRDVPTIAKLKKLQKTASSIAFPQTPNQNIWGMMQQRIVLTQK